MDTRGGQKTSAFSRSNIRRRIFRSSAILATSLAAFAPKPYVKAATKDYTKRLKESALTQPDLGKSLSTGSADPPLRKGGPYPWKTEIVTTTFWVGEKATKNNPVPNLASSWDTRWATSYGGTDTPDRTERKSFQPASFTPRQNPFYVALPYNDVSRGEHKPEAAQVIPWFKEEYKGPGVSVLKDRWIAIRRGNRTAYAQWEDCGPFRTDHSAYVFGNERPKPNLNKGAGLDVSPAVRDYLGMNDTDVTDWKFVEYKEVPQGPWSQLGENNPFVLQRRIDKTRLVEVEETKKRGG
jgi:hypothetical protein